MKDLRDSVVAVVGLGLMGGSLALGLRDKNACRKIIAMDFNPDTRTRAIERGIETYAELNSIAQADVIVVATPVRTITEQMPRVGEIAREGAIILDLGSTKREVVCAMEKLPEPLQPIGGHPMCGKEASGFESADPTLYQNAVFVLTPLARTSNRTVTLISSLTTLLGARPLVLDAERHDKIVAAISHLPFVVAATLILAADELARADDLLFTLAAGGFRDTSRLAASDTKIMLDILLTNSENTAEAMRLYSKRFAELANVIEKRDESVLREMLESAAEKRKNVLSKR